MRMRTVLDDTNWIKNGSTGSTAYSLSGNVMPLKGRRPGSMLSKAMRGASSLRRLRTVPSAFTGSNAARRSAKKYVVLKSWKSPLISTGSLRRRSGSSAETRPKARTARSGKSRLIRFIKPSSVYSLKFLLNAPHLIFHGLFPVGTSSESHSTGDPRHARCMQSFVALLHGSEDAVPITLNVGAVGVQARLESGIRENTLANCDFLRNRKAEADRNNTQIRDDFHNPIVIATERRGFIPSTPRRPPGSASG